MVIALTWVDPLRRRRASPYGAGPTLDDAIEVARRLAGEGLGCTVGYSASPHDTRRTVADMHLAALERLAAEGLDGEVSVKLSALGFDACLFAELDAAAARSAQALHVDALAPDTVEATWGLLRSVPRVGHVGTTLPGRWGRSVEDVRLAGQLGLRVRLVKGQWPDTPARDLDPAAGVLRVVDRVRGHSERVAVATHDGRLLAEALTRLMAAGVPCAAELFLGLPFTASLRVARGLGVPVRVYVAYGTCGAPYGAAELTRNPAAARWLLQDVLLGKEKTWRSIGRARLES